MPDPALPNCHRLFPHAGLAVMRGAKYYLLVTNGVVGTEGFGNHKHNDQLSFEYHFNGAPMIVDPGSYVYTSDPDARNMFRSTGCHNTVRVDGQEQNEMNPEWIFRLFESANAEHDSFVDETDYCQYVGSHQGFSRFENPVMHKRAFRVLKKTGALLIRDWLDVSGAHQLAWHFHFAPGVEVARDGDAFILTNGKARAALKVPSSLKSTVGEGFYSPSYGVKQACRRLDLDAAVNRSGRLEYDFLLCPEDSIADRQEQQAIAGNFQAIKAA